MNLASQYIAKKHKNLVMYILYTKMNYTIPWTVSEPGTKTRKFEVNLHVLTKLFVIIPIQL